MNAVAFDTLAFAKRLQEAGVPVVQAEAQASAQADFLTHHLLSEMATKDDLKISLSELETRLTMRIMKAAAWQFIGTTIVIATLMAMFKLIG